MRVFHSEQELADSSFGWRILAVLSPTTRPDITNLARWERRLREAAGALGANGVIEPDLRDFQSLTGPLLVHPPGSLRARAIRWWPGR